METMLVLNINPELEEDMMDYLLSLSIVRGFTSYPVHGHGEHQGMNIAEQVSGRRKRLQIEVILDEQEIAPLIGGLANAVGKDIVYWQQSISKRGKIN